jgi:hypothetical protein
MVDDECHIAENRDKFDPILDPMFFGHHQGERRARRWLQPYDNRGRPPVGNLRIERPLGAAEVPAALPCSN